MIFAQVAVPVPTRAGSLFTYSVPSSLAVGQGDLVMVPFGSRTLTGIVARVDAASPNMPTRELLGAVVDAPSIGPERVATAFWMADYYCSSLFDTLSLFLPPGWRRAITEVAPAGGMEGRWRFEWPAPPIPDDALVRLNVGSPDGHMLQGVRGRAVIWLRDHGVATVTSVAAGAGCAPSTVRRMVAEGLLNCLDEGALVEKGPPLPQGALSPGGDRRDRHHRALTPWGDEEAAPRLSQGERGSLPPILLNEAQLAAYSPIAGALRDGTHRVFLLHGVTGSGKTHVYLKLIESLVGMGCRAIVLVSEIAQTPEALERYAERFPGRVALLHSELPNAERCRLWRGIAEGHFDVVVGPRSALFAPVPGLGMVVLDEEHEPSYKQEDSSPRYHARETAIQLARQMRAAVVLGSATPDVGSYFLAERSLFHLLTLPGRYAGPTARGHSGGNLPEVEVIDLREELKSGNTGILSRSLKAGIQHVLDGEEQAILFLNRRGASTAVVCRDCGEAVKCRRCDVPMVYHKSLEELVCHQCNRRSPLPQKCPHCKKTRISYFGAGTERVEEEVRRQFPSARVLRWDQDMTGTKGAHARLHRQFREHQADILVGTQMVAKALDFPLVTLVGVVLADVTLRLPDFKAAERTYQLMSQVAGRAGRGAVEGRVVIQTYSPDHYSIVAASHHDYRSFYEQELDFRRFHSYPPYRRLARLLYTGAGEARARVEAIEMRKRLQAKVDEMGIGDAALIGPAPAFHSRLRGRYRWQIVVAGEGLSTLLRAVPLPLGWTLDVDPNTSL